MRKSILALLFFTLQTHCCLYAGTPIPTLHIDLYFLYADSSIYPADGATAQFKAGFNAGVDYVDAPKLGNLNENLGLLRDGQLLSIERRPPVQTSDTLFLNLTKTTQRSYQIQFTPTNFTSGTLLGYIKDAYTGKSILISLDTVTKFNFTVDNTIASQNANRFTIILIAAPGAAPVPVTYSNIEAFQQNNNVAIQWQVQNQLNIKNYSIEKAIDGNNFAAIATINADNKTSVNYKWLDANLFDGESFYRVRSIDINGNIQYSKIVVVDISSAKASINIFPNPIHNGVFSFQLNKMPKGFYHLYLLNNSGQLITTKLINHEEGSSSQTISVNKNVAKGVYRLKVICADNSIKTFQLQFE